MEEIGTYIVGMVGWGILCLVVAALLGVPGVAAALLSVGIVLALIFGLYRLIERLERRRRN